MSDFFVGRTHELETLEQRYNRAAGQLVLVFGRRRIGKSYLLEQFSQGKPTVFYQATQQSEAQELAAFTAAVSEVVGRDYLPAGYHFPGWETALDFLAERAAGSRLLVILDEFSYLLESTNGLASIIQRWWDRRGKDSSIMLVLCGSAQSVLGQLDAQAQPLHQRFTAKLHIGPLNYREAALLVPSLSHADQARVFGILGGTPLYLRQWDASRDVRENLIALFADPASSLVDSAELVLSTDLLDARAPYRVVQAVALGATTHNEIKQQAKLTSERVLLRTIGIGAIEKRSPITEDADRSKRSIYTIGDPYFRFYFRFISTHRGLISRGLGAKLVDQTILPNFDTYMGYIYEDIAREFARELVRQGRLGGDNVGSWWSTDGKHEIDIVGVAGRTPTFGGSVKWRTEFLGEAVLDDLEDDLRALGVAPNLPRLLIGRRGIDPSLAGRRNVRGYSIDDLYA